MTRGDGPRAADAWDPVSAAGCGREQKGENPGGGGAWAGRPGWHSAGRRGFKSDLKQNPNSNASHKFPCVSNFGQLEKYFPQLGKIEIKYGFEHLGGMNNFLYRNFLIFIMDLE
jgi:hypothetical protein